MNYPYWHILGSTPKDNWDHGAALVHVHRPVGKWAAQRLGRHSYSPLIGTDMCRVCGSMVPKGWFDAALLVGARKARA